VFKVFHTYVASVLSGCCICFVMATHVFFKFFWGVLQVFQTYVAIVSVVFGRMLQVFHLKGTKVN
jgi:hypothetical protein